MTAIRLVTYNVHRCVGRNGRDSIADVTALCGEARADVIALQELDAPETDLDDGVHHARDLAAALGMELVFCRTFRRGVGYYGHALLCRHPIALLKATTFPAHGPAAEPRGAIWARATIGRGSSARALDVVSTHLGVSRREREAQLDELLGARWLESDALATPHVLCGDLNIVPYANAYRRISTRLVDAQRAIARGRPKATFPSMLPMFRIDHVFVSRGVAVRGVAVPYDARSRRASDHLPLIVDLDL